MVGGNRVSEHRQDAGCTDISWRRSVPGHVFKIWRTFDICRTGIPLEELARGSVDHLPSLVAFKRFHVGLAEHLGPNRRIDQSEEHTSELQSPYDLVCRLLHEKKHIRSH